tara:strand:- start:132 stop:1244 length:1113 start_codon:yes stop_codon:yes gene_type:complete
MKLLVGYQNTNNTNGYDKNCEWLKSDGIYEKLKNFQEFEIKNVDVNQCNDFYYFPINGNNRDTRLLSEEYFFGKYLNEKVLSDLKNNKCILHINWLDEPYIFNKDEIDRLEKFLFDKNITWNNVLFTSNNFNSEMKHHQPFSFFENSIECNTHYLGFKIIEEDFDYDIRYSKFLSLSRTGHDHRKTLVKLFEKFTDKDILYSALWKDKRIDDRFHWPNVHSEQGMNHGDDHIDLSNYKQNPYLNTYITIVTETNFKNNILQLTDKVFQPIVNLQPFIYVSSCGGLKLIKSLGYQTFDFIDESYDKIENEVERLKFLESEIERLIKMDKNKIHDIYYGIVDVLKHNRKHWLSVGRYRVIKQMEVFYQNIRN